MYESHLKSVILKVKSVKEISSNVKANCFNYPNQVLVMLLYDVNLQPWVGFWVLNIQQTSPGVMSFW